MTLLLVLASLAAAQTRMAAPVEPSAVVQPLPEPAYDAPALPVRGPEALDVSRGVAQDGSLQALVQYTQGRAKTLLDMRRVPAAETVEWETVHGQSILVQGVPRGLRPVSEDVVLRHWTDLEGLRSILASESLLNGSTPYIISVPGIYKKHYRDMTGLFFTLPSVAPRSVGVEQTPYYVDVKLPKGMALLEVERDNIYFVPMGPRMRGWFKDEVLEAMRTGTVKPGYSADAVRRAVAEGGPPPEFAVPVQIVGHSPLP